MGYELTYTSQIDFDGVPLDCFVHNTVFGSCAPLNRLLADIFSGLCSLLNFTLGDFENIGTGEGWYVDASNNPKNFKSFLALPGLALTDTGNELSLEHAFISNNNSMIFAPVGLALDVKSTGGMSFINIGTGTGEIYNIFSAGFFQMRRMNYGYDLDTIFDKGFLKIETVSDDVVIQRRTGGYAIVNHSEVTPVGSIGVKSGIIFGTKTFSSLATFTSNKFLIRHIIQDNICIINYDIDVEFSLEYGVPADGDLMLSFSLVNFNSTTTPNSADLRFFQDNQSYKTICQRTAFYDLGIDVDKDDVDNIGWRYQFNKICEAKLSSQSADIGVDYEWEQFTGGFDQLTFSMFPVLNADKDKIIRFVTRGTLYYNIYLGSNDAVKSIGDWYDESANIEKNF